MNKPMTTAQAIERFGCNCPEEAMCSCQLNSTCSYHCEHCGGHIWYPGFTCNTGNPIQADCPYCGKETKNPYPEFKPRGDNNE